MSQNIVLKMPPGLVTDLTSYSAKQMWHDGNLVRWTEEGALMPVGGWVKTNEFGEVTGPIRSTYSWRSNDFQPWGAVGSEDKAYAFRPGENDNLTDITPDDLVWEPSEMEGYGSGQYGVGRYGLDSESGGGITSKFLEAFWTFHNWGEDLLGVHAIDGRLWYWKQGAATPFEVVANAPIKNYTFIVTNERHVMVLGGDTNPRKVKWCSREDITQWAPSATNSAGGFDLDTTGIILAATHVPQGILVFTDIDVHLIEYIGPPFYYSRRLITHDTGVIGPKAFASTANGVIFMGPNSFWAYSTGVIRVPCPISNDVFTYSNLSKPLRVFMGENEETRETWIFYPYIGSTEPDRVAIFRYDNNDSSTWWSKGILKRTAWLSAIWTEKPYAMDNKDVYQHEIGWTDNGAPRDIWIKSGAMEISNGDTNMLVNRIYHDAVVIKDSLGTTYAPDPVPYSLEFLQANAPQAKKYSTGPITLNSENGFTTTRFKARQIEMTVRQVSQVPWAMGDLRLRVKAMGAR